MEELELPHSKQTLRHGSTEVRESRSTTSHRSLAPASATPKPGAHELNDPTSPPGPSFEADDEKPPVDTQEGEELIALCCLGVLEEPLTESPPRALPTRDVEELLRDVAPCNRPRSAHMWLCALEGLTPEDVPYSVFGVTGFRYKASSTTTIMPSAVASSSPDDTSACDSRYLGV